MGLKDTVPSVNLYLFYIASSAVVLALKYFQDYLNICGSSHPNPSLCLHLSLLLPQMSTTLKFLYPISGFIHESVPLY